MIDIFSEHEPDEPDEDDDRPNSDWWYTRAGAVYFFGGTLLDYIEKELRQLKDYRNVIGSPINR